MGKRITIKEVNTRVDLLRTEIDIIKGSVEALGLEGPRASQAGKILSESLQPLTEQIKGIEGIVNRLLDRVKRLENANNKKPWWKRW